MVEYDILAHGMMIGDRRRMDGYVQALRAVVRPGAVVVDIGSGTGVFSMIACQAGADRVYAIEAGDIIHTAREIAVANGWASRIEFIQAVSTDVTLPERADVVVLDVRGVLPDEQIRVAADARRRFLKPEGRIVPEQDAVWLTILSASEIYDRAIGHWSESDGVDMRAARDVVARGRFKCRVTPGDMLVEPKLVYTCDYAVDEARDVVASVGWTLNEAVVARGVGAWFESLLAPGVHLSNRPGAPEVLYGQAYFPWVEPVAMDKGATVEIELIGRDDGQGYHLAMGRVSITPEHSH